MKKKSLIIGLILIAVVCVLGLTTKSNAAVEKIDFADNEALCEAVKSELESQQIVYDIGEGNIIFVDTNNVTELNISEAEIYDISALKPFTALKILVIPYNNISDISVVSNFTNLEELSMQCNLIEDISPISNLTNLKYLSFGENRVSDMSYLSDLVNLQYLECSANKLGYDEVNVLENLTNLQYLYISENFFDDLSVIEKLIKLRDYDCTEQKFKATYQANVTKAELYPIFKGETLKITTTGNATAEVVNGYVLFSNVNVGDTVKLTVSDESSMVYGSQITYYFQKVLYKVSLEEPENGTLLVNNNTSMSSVSEQMIPVTATPDEGYKLKFVKILKLSDNTDVTSEVSYNEEEKKFIMPEYDVKVVAEFEKITTESNKYEFLEGENGSIVNTSNEDLTFRIDADYSLFDKVFVDDIEVNPNNYTTKSGSTIVTLKNEYLKTLDEGEHTLKVAFTDGGEATTNFEIKTEEIDNTENTNPNIPQTGDEIYVASIVFAIIVLGNVVYFVKRKK